jgi:hypothetical protein
MNKSIWHTAGFHEAIDDKLKVSRDGKMVYWTMYGWNIPGDDAHDIGCEWCYLTDLLALETENKKLRQALQSIYNYTKIVSGELAKNCLGQFQKPISKIGDMAHIALKQAEQKDK